jgi:hypothetical protein
METRITETYKRSQTFAEKAIQYAVECGNALIVSNGEGMPTELATKLMRLARHPELAVADGTVFLELIVDKLLQLLEKPLEVHKICAVLPWLGESELSALADDIQKHGLLMPITLYEGKVLDGKNRHKACLMAGVQPAYEEYEGDDPVGFVASKNLCRSSYLAPIRAEIQKAADSLLVENSLIAPELMKRWKINSVQMEALKGMRRMPKFFLLNHETRYSIDAVEAKEAGLLDHARRDGNFLQDGIQVRRLYPATV